MHFKQFKLFIFQVELSVSQMSLAFKISLTTTPHIDPKVPLHNSSLQIGVQ